MTISENLKKYFPNGLIGIIYDCDGVMIDSDEANRCFYNAALAAFNLPPMTKEQETYAFMASAREALLRMIPEHLHSRIDEVCGKAVNYSRDVLPQIKLMPGFLQFIEDCHRQRLSQAIDTNRTEEGIQRILDFFHLPRYFYPVINVSKFMPKPSPEGVLYICEQWRAEPNQALFVGDSEIDRQTAKSAGSIFAALNRKGLPCDIAVSGFAELARLLWPDP